MKLVDNILTAAASRATVFRTSDGEVHDRNKTVGASENYNCLRRTWFDKHGTAPDQGKSANWGFFERGHVIEDWTVGVIHEALPEGAQLLYAGDEQVTLIEGCVSATPDGLLVMPDGEEIVLEFKSLDPRSNFNRPKPNHVQQVNVQMQLFRTQTKHRPEKAWLIYVDSADFSHIVQHEVLRSGDVEQNIFDRAYRALYSEDPMDLPAEGQFADECRYCPFTEACGQAVINAYPSESAPGRIDPPTEEHLGGLVAMRTEVEEQIKRLTKEKKSIEETIKRVLRQHETRAAKGRDWSISYSMVAGRRTLDTAALEEDGVDLEPYYKVGKQSERLTIKAG